MFGPEFAMLRTPRPVWDRFGRNSSLKGFPQKDSPPGIGEGGWDRSTGEERKVETSHLFITASNSADGHINILRNIKLFCYENCLVLNFSTACCLSLIRFAVEDKICFCRWSLHICSNNRPFSQIILTFHSRISRGVINNNNDGCSPFWCAGFRALVLCLLLHWL